MSLSGRPFEQGTENIVNPLQLQIVFLERSVDVVASDLDAVDLEDVQVVREFLVHTEQLLRCEVAVFNM